MTKPIKASELEQIMAEALAELMHQAQRANGIRNAEHTRQRAEEWRSGPRSPLGATGPRGSDVSDPTGNKRTDDGDDMANNLTAAWRRIRDDMRNLRTITTGIHSHATSDVGTRAPKSPLGAGTCRACGISCSGADDDRLRGGLCDADRKRFARNPGHWGHDQVTFERARMRDETDDQYGFCTYHA